LGVGIARLLSATKKFLDILYDFVVTLKVWRNGQDWKETEK